MPEIYCRICNKVYQVSVNWFKGGHMRHREGGAVQEVCPVGHVLALQATFDMIVGKKRMTPKHD